LAASLVASLKDFRRNMGPDFLFIEPSELVVTSEMRDVTSMGRRDVTYDIGPFITLVDGPAFPTLWQERRPLLLGQLAGADMVAISKSDLVDAGRLEEIYQSLKGYCRDLIQLSTRSGAGLEEVLKTFATLSSNSHKIGC
jgi:G3E family GTPase